MSHPIVRTVSTLVNGGDVEGAERALAVIADQEGDRALATIIDAMPPRDVVAILREHDASRMSIVGALISPEQFAAAVALERDYGDRTHEALRGMVNAVVFADEDRTDDFIVALGGTEAGLNALCDYFSDRHAEIERFFRHGTFDPNAGDEDDEIPRGNADLQHGELDADTRRDVVPLREVQDQDWHELAWRLRCERYEISREMMEMLRARHFRALDAPPPPPPKAEGAADDDEDDVL
ncbi:MAG: hypothetical protein WCK28_09540 [Burkholderiales bacterium]